MDYGRIVFENAGDTDSAVAPGYAFVGIYMQGEQPVFRLPLGYPRPSTSDYNAARDLHIVFFKLFYRFRAIARQNHERRKNSASAHEDNGPATDRGREWVASHEEGSVFYYRYFDVFDSLLEAFDELTLLGLERKLRFSDGQPGDLRDFQRTDAGRIYQPNDSFYDDVSLQPRPTVTLLSSDLIGLYCFLVRDLREHVWAAEDPSPLQDEIRVLADNFEERHLWPTASCWEADEWDRTIAVLRDQLDIIDRKTALKDDEYFHIYQAVEQFLYRPADDRGGTGKLWGIDGFWPVWEWMVLTRLASAPQFRQRLLWVETGNLAMETLSDLGNRGFRHPQNDPRVLCHGSSDWESFQDNSWNVGHPYPDAILHPAEFGKTLNSWGDKTWNWIDVLTLTEGPVSMTLAGLSDQLALSTEKPPEVRIRSKPNRPELAVSEDTELRPTLKAMTNPCVDLDRPELFAMLRRLGKWGTGSGNISHYKPFSKMKNVTRPHMDGVLLVDAKYKRPGNRQQQWQNDHRKQASYEDVLTISCPETPAAYSIYICPGPPVTETPPARLRMQLRKKEQFDREFEAKWRNLKDAVTERGTFKNANQVIEVFGKKATVGFGRPQRDNAYRSLIAGIFDSELKEEIDQNALASSLLAVEIFPGDSNFFVKHWSISELIYLMLNENGID